jgi:hypothetical protein
MLRLTPAKHGTDGFFVAICERRASAAEVDEPPRHQGTKEEDDEATGA